MQSTFELPVLPWWTLISIDHVNEASRLVAAGRAGSGEEFRWSAAGGSQTAAFQRQLPQSTTVHPRHSSHSLEKQTASKVSGEASYLADEAANDRVFKYAKVLSE